MTHGGIERVAQDLVLPGRLDGLGHLPLDGDERLPRLGQLPAGQASFTSGNCVRWTLSALPG